MSQGYGNTEKVELSALLESDGLQSQIAQQKDADTEKLVEAQETDSVTIKSKKYNGEKMECDEDTKPYRHHFMAGPSVTPVEDMMPPAPPLPPQLMAK